MKIQKEHVIYTIIFSVFIGNFLLPPIVFLKLSLRVGDFILIFLIPFLFFFRTRKTIPVALYLSFYISIILSTIYGYAFLNVPPSLRDLNELIRLALPLVFLVLSYNVKDNAFFVPVRKLIIISSLFILLLGMMQMMFPNSVGGMLTAFYASEERSTGTYLQKRLLLTGSDPNVGAAIAIYFAISNLSFYLSTSKLKFLFLFLSLSTIIGLTGSRTGILALFAGCVALFVLHKRKRKVIFDIKKIVMILFVFFAIFTAAMQSDYIKIGFETAMKGENTSLNVRIEYFKKAYNLFKESPIVGWGPAKLIHETIVDGEYFLLLRRYGILGTCFLVFFLSSLVFSLIRGATKNRRNEVYNDSAYAISIGLASYLLSMYVIMLTNNFISGYQIFLPILGFTGAIHSLMIYNEKHGL